MNAKVTNLTSPRTGNPVANQFEITTNKYYIFQSYETIIAKIERGFQGKTTLDKNALDDSKTTLKYLNSADKVGSYVSYVPLKLLYLKDMLNFIFF